MRKQLMIGLLLCVLMAAQAFAVEDRVQEPSFSSTQYYDRAEGAPMNGLGMDTLGPIDKLRVGSATGGGLTMIDGALCSAFPNTESEYTPSKPDVERICSTNQNHIGVAFQMFHVEDDGDWKFKGERQLSLNEKGCFDVEYEENYVLHWYHCDDTEKSCTDYESTVSCADPAEGGPYTVRERTCTQDGQTDTESVTVSYHDPDATQVCDIPSDGDDAEQDDASGGDTGDDGSGELNVCEGEWTEVSFPTNVRPSETYSGMGRFTASANGTCIFSAAMLEGPRTTLSVAVDAEGSACGQPDVHVAEVKTAVEAGQEYVINFNDMQARQVAGVHDVYVGAWNGCYVDGGSQQDATFQPVNVLTIGGEIDQRLAYLGGLSGLLVLAGGLLLLVGVVMWLKQK